MPATRTIAVDLTQLRAGGENGGAKLVATELTRELSHVATDWQFLLLTDECNHEELRALTSENVERVRVTNDTAPARPRSWAKQAVIGSVKRLAGAQFARVKSVLRRFRRPTLPQLAGADLVFCPFGEVRFAMRSVPAVATIHDSQHVRYPQFFDAAELARRQEALRSTCRRAARIVCDSRYVRDTLTDELGVSGGQVEVIPLRINGMGEPAEPAQQESLSAHGLTDCRFLLYPANFWRHKNHNVLLTAFGMFRSRRPDSDLKLVLTGEPLDLGTEMREHARRMGLADVVVFTGYVSTTEIATFQHRCRALIFPSLYEGFGLPVLEAMRIGRPVLCSNTTSLPELVGNAALRFDPRQPRQILGAIEQLEDETSLAADLSERGRARAASLGGIPQMVQSYLEVFESVLGRTGQACV